MAEFLPNGTKFSFQHGNLNASKIRSPGDSAEFATIGQASSTAEIAPSGGGQDALCCVMPTESAYLDWIKRYILFHIKRHPREMGAAEIDGWAEVKGPAESTL